MKYISNTSQHQSRLQVKDKTLQGSNFKWLQREQLDSIQSDPSLKSEIETPADLWTAENFSSSHILANKDERNPTCRLSKEPYIYIPILNLPFGKQ